MDAHVRDALVSGYEDLMPAIQLPDPNDRHVVAAAIVSRPVVSSKHGNGSGSWSFGRPDGDGRILARCRFSADVSSVRL